MQPEKPKLPNEAIELYNRYIHGEISRRDFLNGAKRFAIAGLTAGAIVEALMPNYALGAAGIQDRRSDQGQLRDRSVSPREREHQGLSRPSFQRRHANRNRSKAAWHPRRARESRPESSYRGHCAAARPRELHGVCAGRAHLCRRLSGRRLQRRPAVRQGRTGRRCRKTSWRPRSG